MTPNAMNPKKNFVYKRGEECDFFVLLLEGELKLLCQYYFQKIDFIEIILIFATNFKSKS